MKIQMNREKLGKYTPHLSTLAACIAVLITFLFTAHIRILAFWLSLIAGMIAAYLSFVIIRKRIYSLGAIGSSLGVFAGFFLPLYEMLFLSLSLDLVFGSDYTQIANYFVFFLLHPWDYFFHSFYLYRYTPLWEVLLDNMDSILSLAVSIPFLSFYFGKWGMMREEMGHTEEKRWVLIALFSFIGYSVCYKYYFLFVYLVFFFAFIYEYSLFRIRYENSESFKRSKYKSFMMNLSISYVLWFPLLLTPLYLSYLSEAFLWFPFYLFGSFFPFLIVYGIFLSKRRV